MKIVATVTFEVKVKRTIEATSVDQASSLLRHRVRRQIEAMVQGSQAEFLSSEAHTK